MGKFDQSGQTLLIIVLVMVVTLTVGLSVASRSITNLRTATEEENSQRAFTAAEAGVEQVLKTGNPISTEVQLSNNASIRRVTTTNISGTQFVPNNGNDITKDDGIDIWLSNNPDYSSQWSGNLTINWGNRATSDPCGHAALEIIVISGPTASPVSRRYTFDPCSSRQTGNNFTLASTTGDTVGGIQFAFKSPQIAVASGIIARVVSLYANTPIGVVASIGLPSQGKQIQSTGASGGTVRQVTYFQGFPELPPEFFQYILFQPSSSL